MTESISTPNALVQTTNGKRFFVHSGLVSVANTEIAVVDIDNIGERDIKLIINAILTDNNSDNMSLRVKNNGFLIYETIFDVQSSFYAPYAYHFIIPANTSLAITFQNQDGTSHNVGVSAYGKYLSMD